VKATSIAWLTGAGPSSGIVLSTRLRLARNLSGYPFPSLGHLPSLSEIAERLGAILSGWGGFRYCDLGRAKALEVHVLVEQHLISPALAASAVPRGLALGPEARVSVMVNEEDHLRLQCLLPGLQFEQCYAEVARAERSLSRQANYSFDEQFGYLTACPSNVGTGLRASAMLHLPALVWLNALDPVMRQVTRLGLTWRGLFGEGSHSAGHLLQVSNQVTLGPTEAEILEKIEAVCTQVLQYELSAREQLVASQRLQLEDRVWRSYALLRSARLLELSEHFEHLSMVRLGSSLGLLPEVPVALLNGLLVRARPASLQSLAATELGSVQRDRLRAEVVRESLNEPET
jgi:protein arginine kinase